MKSLSQLGFVGGMCVVLACSLVCCTLAKASVCILLFVVCSELDSVHLCVTLFCLACLLHYVSVPHEYCPCIWWRHDLLFFHSIVTSVN